MSENERKKSIAGAYKLFKDDDTNYAIIMTVEGISVQMWERSS